MTAPRVAGRGTWASVMRWLVLGAHTMEVAAVLAAFLAQSETRATFFYAIAVYLHLARRELREASDA